jgi:uncharacterized protein DUF5719
VNRTTLSLLAAGTTLAAVTAAAAVTMPSGTSPTAANAQRLPVQRSSLVCPRPTSSDLAETRYTAFTPKSDAASGAKQSGGTSAASAALLPAPVHELGSPSSSSKKGGKHDGGNKAIVPLKAPGKPVTTTVDTGDAPARYGSADGPLAPGWTVQQTTEVAAGAGRGLLGTQCAAPDTDFWFPGASTAKDRQDYVHLTNPDDTGAVVDLELYGKDGLIKSPTGEGITVPPHSTVPVLLSTLTSDAATNLTLHVLVRSGRIGAQVQAVDTKLGSDWLPRSAVPGPSVVIPGIPADADQVRLVIFAPGDQDADLKVSLAAPSGRFTPAGHETLHVKSGMTTAVDLKDLTKGEAGSLVLTPADGSSKTPVVAAARVVGGKSGEQESAFIPATLPIQRRGTVADNRKGESTLSLTAPDAPATVKVTASAGSDGGTPQSKTYTLKKGTTVAVKPPVPKGGKGTYALTVEPLSGGPVYAARTLARDVGGIKGFTVQPIPDDGGTVEVPHAHEDLSLLNR